MEARVHSTPWTNQIHSLAEEAKTKAPMGHRIVGAILVTMGGGGRITSIKVVPSHVPSGNYFPTVIMDTISF